jgi:prepilin-type processing-associated H-X9-DG protein
MTENETLMLETFIAQIIAVLLGGVSMAAANYLFQDGHIRWRLHSVWVSCSITGICFPVVAWTSTAFLGSGVLSDLSIGILGSAILSWVYRNLPRFPSARKSAHDLSPPPCQARKNPIKPQPPRLRSMLFDILR